MYEFKLPDLGEGVAEGEILHWYVKEGDVIKEDEPLVEIETDKAAVTIPSPKGGRVASVRGNVGDRIAVGTVLVAIDEAAAATEPAPAPAEKKAAAAPAEKKAAPAAAAKATPAKPAAVERAPSTPPAPTAASAPAPAPAVAAPATGPVAAAPATRRLARELGVDISHVPGSGPGGRVTTEDLQAFTDRSTGRPAAATADGGAAAAPATASAPAEQTASPAMAAAAVGGATGIPFLQVEALPDFSAEGPVEIEAVRSIRRKVAHKMVTSMVLVPHVSHMDEADVTDLDAFRRRENQRRAEETGKLTMLSFVIKALTKELKQFPQLNASLDPFRQEIIYKKYYNIGFAADTEKGLVVPVVHHADTKSVIEIAREIETLAGRARAGKLDVAELKGGTFTVTNVGTLGGTNVIPTINYPDVAILGMGRAADRPVVREGRIVIRKILPLTLTFDHRLIDGADGARFMTALVRKLADPHTLLLES